MAVRSLVLVFVVCFLSWLAAAAAVIYAAHRSALERDLLVRVVCESVLIREEHNDPAASIFRARFDAVLAEAGESCPTERS